MKSTARLSAVRSGLLFALFTSSALADPVLYTAQAGDTVEAIAADYYGNRALSIFITEANGLKGGKLKAGQRIKIPTAFHYRLRRGDTLEALSQRFLEDRRRVPYLAQINSIHPTDRLQQGQDLIIPFHHVHHAVAPESLQSVARLYYGDPQKGKLLADYNFRSSPMLAKNDKVIVPIWAVRVRSVRLTSAPTQEAPTRETQRKETELAARIGAQLALIEQSYKEGNYADVPPALDKLLTDEEPSETQLADIFRLKAYAYVALGMDELAVNTFREVIARQPNLVLDEATVSPKIRAVFEKARAQKLQ
jgi:LysM repeat protein